MKKYNTSSSIKGKDSLKSPSPDRHAHNILTPTQIKYSYNLHHEINKSSSSSKEINNKLEQQNSQLKVQVKELKAQNSRLMKILQKYSQTQQQSTATLNVPKRKNQDQILDKIKEQYQQNIKILKDMLGQEIERCMQSVEQVCRVMEKKVTQNELRLRELEKQLKTINIARAQKSLNQLYNSKQELSEVYCESIPQQSYEQSRTQSFRHVDSSQVQIAKLNQVLKELEESYKKEKQQLKNLIIDKDNQIQALSKLTQKMKLQKQKKESQSFIKQQLQLLKVDVQKLQNYLISLQKQHNQALSELDDKNMQIQNFNKEIGHLHEKVLENEKHRAMLEQKNRYLESSGDILQKQLRERKKILDELMANKFKTERQKINSKYEQDKVKKKEKMMLTARIDKLLNMEQERIHKNP